MIQPMENVTVLLDGQVPKMMTVNVSQHQASNFQVFTAMSPALQVSMDRTVMKSAIVESLDNAIMCLESVSVDLGPGGSTVSCSVHLADMGWTVTPAVTVRLSTARDVTRSLEFVSVVTDGEVTSVTPSVRRGGGGRTAAWTVGVAGDPVITRLASAPAVQDTKGAAAQTRAFKGILASTVARNAPYATQVSNNKALNIVE